MSQSLQARCIGFISNDRWAKLIHAYTTIHYIHYTADDRTDLVDALRRFAVVYYRKVLK